MPTDPSPGLQPPNNQGCFAGLSKCHSFMNNPSYDRAPTSTRNLQRFLTPQPLQAELQQILEGNGLDPTVEW